MKVEKNRSTQGDNLRKRAEVLARDRAATQSEGLALPSLEAMQQVLYELRVHQIELEMQNEELRRAQEDLEASRARYFDLYDLAPVGYFTLNENGLIMEANLTAAGLLNLARNALVRQPLSHFILPEDQDIYFRHRNQLIESAAQQVCELRLLRTGAAPFWARLVSAVARDREGAAAYRAVVSDISALRLAEEERQKLETQLRRTLKMDAVGRLAGGVAHDFNNMLQVITSSAELALKEISPSDPLHAQINSIEKAAQRSAELVQQLLAFARKQRIAPKVLDLNRTIAVMLVMLQGLIGDDIEVVWKPAEGLWPVKVDPVQIDHIMANLAVNARDAMSGVGRMTIETGKAEFDAVWCHTHPGVQPGQYVLLAVTDDGIGMDRQTQAQLFEPFFTTKPQGKGMGLGLATVYGIVTQNNGFIDVSSKPGAGTTFTIYLPREHATAEAIAEGRKHSEAPMGTETVLLVEDEDALLQLGTELLEELGYTVLPAGSPKKALQLAAEHAGDIHLLLTDVVMPEMNGRDLRERLRAVRPGTKCLYMSGYTADIIARRGVLEEGVQFLQKPFSREALASKIREALENREGAG